MTKQIDVQGTVEKVVRVNGKSEAQIVITVPASLSGDIPMGKVRCQLGAQQGELFNRPMRGEESNRHPVGKKVAGARA